MAKGSVRHMFESMNNYRIGKLRTQICHYVRFDFFDVISFTPSSGCRRCCEGNAIGLLIIIIVIVQSKRGIGLSSLASLSRTDGAQAEELGPKWCGAFKAFEEYW